jgi:hypothetical protein
VSALTARQQSFIDMMKQSDELEWKGFQLLLQRPDYPRFFDVLQRAEFFAPTRNPAPVAGERENTVRIPFWAPLEYLKAVAKRAGQENDTELAEKVMNVIRDVNAWRDGSGEPRRNYRTNWAFAEILGLVPTIVVSVSDLDLLLGHWFNDPYERMLIAVALDKGALARFLGSADQQDWKKAVRVLYHVTACTWRRDAGEREPAPVGVVDDFSLGELLKHQAKQIGAKAGSEAAEVMIERVREVFSTPLRRDFSSLFRPAVQDDAQNYQWRSIENRVVEGLRDVLLGWSDNDPNSARLVIERMLRDDLQMIRRVGVYVMAQQWASMPDLYSCATVQSLFNAGHSHELHHFLQDHFAEMSPEQQSMTLRAIENLPTHACGQEQENLRRHSQYRWLSAIKGKGYAPADQLFAELDADPNLGKLGDHPDFDSYITHGVGPGKTPYSPDDLVALTQANSLVDELNKFTPTNDWRGPTNDGLTSALETAARTSPDIFLAGLPQLLSTKSIYQHAVICGLKGAWEANSEANWERGWGQLVSFFEALSNDQHFWQQTEDVYRQWVVSAIADCLRAGTKQDEHAYPSDLLPRTQLIIGSLLEGEPAVDTPADDSMTQALNTPKGRIIEALYSQTLRAARVSDRQHSSHREAWEAISPIFDAELAKCKNANYEFSTLAGTYLPQLQYLDATWTSERVDLIFPSQYEANTVSALDGLAYASFTRQVYEVLAEHGIINRALDLELKGRSARGKLVERIGAAYLWGLERLDGSAFRKLFDTGTAEDFEVLVRVFWMIRNENLADEQRRLILTFWSRTFEWAQHQTQVPDRFLSTLSLLATHIRTLGRDERRLLEDVAPHVCAGYEAYEFVAELLRLAAQDPAAITTVLQSMVAAHAPDYDYEDRLRSLLEFLAAHGEREAVILTSNQLRHLPGIATLFKSLTQR